MSRDLETFLSSLILFTGLTHFCQLSPIYLYVFAALTRYIFLSNVFKTFHLNLQRHRKSLFFPGLFFPVEMNLLVSNQICWITIFRIRKFWSNAQKNSEYPEFRNCNASSWSSSRVIIRQNSTKNYNHLNNSIKVITEARLRAAGQLAVADLEPLHGVPGAPRRLVVGRAHKLHRQLKQKRPSKTL